MNNKRKPLSERFWRKVARTGHDDCWLWTAGTNHLGYGQIAVPGGGALLMAHRVSWELHNGPIQNGLHACHRCDTPSCVNPLHLFLGTAADNAADREAKGRGVRGSRQHSSKLTENDVRMIRDTYQDGGVSQTALARFFGVNQASIQRIVRREHWKHIPPAQTKRASGASL